MKTLRTVTLFEHKFSFGNILSTGTLRQRKN